MKEKKLTELSDADLDAVTGGTSAAVFAVSAMERLTPTGMPRWATPADIGHVVSPTSTLEPGFAHHDTADIGPVASPATLEAGVAHHDTTTEDGGLSHDALMFAVSVPFVGSASK